MSESGTCTSIINLRYQDGSEGSSSNPAKFKNQDYAQLKDNYRRRRQLFVDSEFPPNNRSLGDLPALTSWQEDDVEWLRPSEILKAQNISDEPTFCTKGASRFDFGQGSVGNCWFLAAISSLTFQKRLMAQVVPLDQTFSDYAGIFHFRFWRFGKWVDVVIDDYLPTYNKQLLSVHCKGGNEFWVPLLEKAYAKVCGTYADMTSGLPSEACKDFTGGVNMTYSLRRDHTTGHDDELWLQLSRATGCKSMVCCGTPPKGGSNANTIGHTGLVDSHAYAVTGVTEVKYYGSTVRLVRLMNPWGKQEWQGEWSDKSDMWDRVRPEDREKCADREDGEFWMKLEDFCYYFSMASISCENPNFLDGDLDVQWQCMVYDGKWVAGRSAGGNVNNSTFSSNPQYRIEVSIIDNEEKADKNILLSLMQKPQQEYRKKIRYFPVGLTLYKIPAGTPAGRLRSSFFRRNRPIKRSQQYSSERELIELHSLEPGEYVIIPSTMKAYTPGEFVLSVFTKTDAKITSHEEDEHDHDHDHDHDSDNEEDNRILPEIPDKAKEEDEKKDHDPSRAIFKRYADQYDNLSARQLRKLLNDRFPHGTRYGFSLESCRSMIAAVDLDQRMRMSFTEFTVLWKKIHEFKKTFNQYDSNGNGSLTEAELQRAIQGSGIEMDMFMIKLMMFRFSDFSTTSLESFISLMFRLEKMSNTFKNNSSDGVIHLKWSEWSNISMYN